jgi:hypothetical protein
MTATTDALYNNIRTRAPQVLDEVIDLELFNCIDEFTRHYLQATPPTRGSLLTTWLSAAQFDEYFTLLVDGTLARILSQQNKPYFDAALAAYHDQRYQFAAMRARDEYNAETSPSIFNRLMDTLRVHLPNAKDGTIELELFNTIDEWCRETLTYNETLEITLTAGVVNYDLTVAGKTLVAITSWEHASLDVTDGVVDEDTDVIALGVAPTAADVAAGPLFVEVIYVPTNDVAPASLLPEKLWTRHYQALIDGVLSRMMAQPAKPYTNERLAAYHARRFRKHIGQARADVLESFVGDQPWSFPPTF